MKLINVWASVPVAAVEEAKQAREAVSLEPVKGEVVKGEPVKEAISAERVKVLSAEVASTDLRKTAVVKQAERRLLDLYLREDEFDQAVAELQKDPEIEILGVWGWDGSVREGFVIDKEAIKAFMPARYDEEGNEIADDTPRDVVLVYGQRPREWFA
jgi:hypothetical protein